MPPGMLRRVLLLALAVRLAVAMSFPNVIGLDEVFQYLEQAHRLVFGQGIIPWEYQVGLRNWLIPLLLAGPMALSHPVFANPLAGLVLIRVLLCLAALPIVGCAVGWGWRFYGAQGAWVAGLFTAFWPDLWLMAPHPLEEVLAADILVPAVYLICAAPADGGRRAVAWAGFLLGAAFTLRVQLAPAIALGGIALCGRDAGRWRLAVACGALPVLLAGGLDWIAWGQPFRSFWLNIDLNLVHGVAAAAFGASPAWYFLYLLALDWLWMLPVMLYLIFRGATVLRLPTLMALLICITHSFVGHKELRFIFPAIALAVPLAGVGLAGLAARMEVWRPRLVAMLAFALAGPFCSPWLYYSLRFQVGSFQAFEHAAAGHPGLVAVSNWQHVFLPLDILFDSRTRLIDLADAARAGVRPDDIIALRNDPSIPPDYRLQRCFQPPVWIPFAASPKPDLCVWSARDASSPQVALPPPQFPVPPAAKPFIIRDWIATIDTARLSSGD